jgi:hypothetical protein
LRFSVRSTDAEKRRIWLVAKGPALRILAKCSRGFIQDISLDVGLAANMLNRILASAVTAMVKKIRSSLPEATTRDSAVNGLTHREERKMGEYFLVQVENQAASLEDGTMDRIQCSQSNRSKGTGKLRYQKCEAPFDQTRTTSDQFVNKVNGSNNDTAQTFTNSLNPGSL